MTKMHVLYVATVISIISSAESSFWGIQWLWNSYDSRQTPKAIGAVIDNVPVPNVQYESKTDDDKFLEAAKKYTDIQLAELDTCQHKIVMQIRSSCSEMSEEELAKLSVNLLNCQSAVEGRKQYPCKEKMSLKECTGAMDPDTWNAYHLMSNRARAVCYAARQQQFRALSEMTVNKLMSTAHEQLSTMEKLKVGQQKLESFTVGTLQAVAEGQDSLLQQQERMRVTQQGLRDFVGQNLRDLTREKALIAAGHKELSKLTEDIKAKLDAASSQLMLQSSEQSGNHQQIVQDLEFIKEQAKVIWSEIETSTQEIMAQHEAASVKYEDTLEKLAKINNTVTFLLQLMEKMHDELNDRIGWLSHVVGAAGIYTFCMHIAYLLVGMITTAFIQAPAVTRLCLLLIVPLNLTAIYQEGYEHSLDFISMTLIIIFFSAVHWFTVTLLAFSRKRKHISRGLPEDTKMANGQLYTVMSEPDINTQFSSWLGRWRGTASKMIGNSKRWIKLHSSAVNEKKNLSNHSGSDEPDGSEESEAETEFSLSAFRLQRDGVARRRLATEEQESGTLYRPFRPPLTPPRTLSRSGTPLQVSSSRSETPMRASASRSGTPRPICGAVCRNGTPCRNSTLAGHDVCRVHLRD